jgi:hypothetical protein
MGDETFIDPSTPLPHIVDSLRHPYLIDVPQTDPPHRGMDLGGVECLTRSDYGIP